jgi:hypothetical protein
MEDDIMKSKTVAESIAELRDRLTSLDCTPANTTLNESAQSLNSLQEHMQQVEQDYLFEKGSPGHKGSIGNWIYNAKRGLYGEKTAKPGLEKIPGTDNYGATGPLTKGDKGAWEVGKGIRRSVGGGIVGAGLGGAASLDHKLTTGNWLPGGNTNDTTDGKINGQLDGGDPKPRTNPNYDEKTAHLQQWLLDQGADLGTTGPNGDGVDGVMGEKTRQAAKDHHVAGYEDSTPPVTQNAPPVTQNAPPVTQNAPPVTQNAPPAGNSNAEFQSIVDKFEKTFRELEGLTKGDPEAQRELEQIRRSAGY